MTADNAPDLSLLLDYRRYAPTLLKVKDREGGRLVSCQLKPIQLRIDEAIEGCLARGRPARIMVDKSRRLGVSTYTASKFFHRTATRPYQSGSVIAHRGDSTAKIFKIYERFWENLPEHWGDVPTKPQRKGAKSKALVFPGLDSELVVGTVGKGDYGRGDGLQMIHGCLHGDTLVMIDDGSLVPLREIEPGMTVRTHRGRRAVVKRVWRTPATLLPGGGAMVVIWTYLHSEPIVLTPDHKVWTRRGWVPASELTTRDAIGSPIPKIEHRSGYASRALPKFGHAPRHQDTPETIPLTRETGFLVGYYLAEGSLVRQYRTPHHPSALCFSHDRDETQWIKRIERSVGHYFSSLSTKTRIGSRSAVTLAYGGRMARWVLREFRDVDRKRIPEWVFQATPDFLAGLVEGYVAGDGSKGLGTGDYRTRQISVTSVRPRLLVQLRRILGALGWGWGALSRRDGYVDARGWKCREAWTLKFSGRAAAECRERLGLARSDDRARSVRVRQRGGRFRLWQKTAWVNIRRITSTWADEAWDLEVDDGDHSFTLLQGAVANSEVAYWEDPETVIQSLMPSVPKTGDSIVILESTAKGPKDWWHRTWKKAKDGIGYIPLFFAWFEDPEHRLGTELPRDMWDEEDAKLVADVGPAAGVSIDGFQLAWRHWTLEEDCGGRIDRFRREHPSTEEESFVSVGDSAWDANQILACYQKMPVRWRGELVKDGVRHDPSGRLRVWEEPQPRAQYVVGVDVAAGLATGDLSVASVFRVGRRPGEWPVQVAEWSPEQDQDGHVIGNPESVVFAEILTMLGFYYQKALLAVEVTGIGRPVQNALQRVYFYPNLHRWVRWDSGKQRSDTYGWETTWKSKEVMLGLSDWMIRSRKCVIRSPWLVEELLNYQQVGPDEYAGTRGDDRIMSWMIANCSFFQHQFAGVPLKELRQTLARLYGATEVSQVIAGPRPPEAEPVPIAVGGESPRRDWWTKRRYQGGEGEW